MAGGSQRCPRRRRSCSTPPCPLLEPRQPSRLLGDATSDRFVAAVKACLADPGVNGILLLYTPQGNARPDEMAARVSALVKGSPKPVITVLMGGETVIAGREIFKLGGGSLLQHARGGGPHYLSMYQYARNLELLYETPAELPIDIAPPSTTCRRCCGRIAKSGRTVLTEEESKRFVTTYGFPVVEQVIADDLPRRSSRRRRSAIRSFSRSSRTTSRTRALPAEWRWASARRRPRDGVRPHYETREEELAQSRH